MKWIMICVAALLLIFCVASAEEAPATYAEVRTMYGLPNVIPSNAGLEVDHNSVCVWNLFHAFNKGVITYTDEGGEKVTVEGIYNSKFHQFDWPTSTLGVEDQDGNITLPADATVELTGEVPCGEGYRGEMVYRWALGDDPLSTMIAFENHMEYTGLRLYDQTGAKVLEVWPKAGEFELRCMAVTFYPAEGDAYTVEYLPDPGDVDADAYTLMAQRLTADNIALAHPGDAPRTLEEALAFFPTADFSLDFTPAFDLEGAVKVTGIPADVEVLYASLQLMDMGWYTTSSWKLTPDGAGAYVLSDPTVLPRVMEGMTDGTVGGLMIFYRDETGLVMHAQYMEMAGWFVALQATTEEGYISLTMTPYEAQVSCSDKNYTPLWHAYYDLETGERTLYHEE